MAGISLVKVFGGGGMGGSLDDAPQLSYTGTWFAHVIKYGDDWYYEYIMTAGGTLTAQLAYVCDIMLIGGGGQGAIGPVGSIYSYPSPGGGSGYATYRVGELLTPGEHAVSMGAAAQSRFVFGESDTATAVAGGNASATNTSSTVGAGFTGNYYAYGDSAISLGAGGGATTGSGLASFPVPGRGGGGCRISPYPTPGPAYRRQSSASTQNWVPVAATYYGFGAGAQGRTPAITYNGDSFPAWTTTPCAGCVCIRVKV